MSVKIIPIIMSGGSGTRLWPISNDKKPKQFHALGTSNTMIQDTALRMVDEIFLSPIIICGKNHLHHVKSQLEQINQDPSHIVLEPMGRNTAAVAAIAALMAKKIDKDALVLLLPADHVVAFKDNFIAAVKKSINIAKSNIVTFGINPDKPETGFGYIESGEEIENNVHKVKQFHEKPNLETAISFLNGGKHFWNAGIFLFSPNIVLEELKTYAEQVLEFSSKSLENAHIDKNIIALNHDDFAKVPSISIDYAIMEKTDKAAVTPCDIGWADVGSFQELWRISPKDENGNVNDCNAIIIDSKNNLILSDKTPVSLIGIEDLMVIISDEGILIAPKSRSQDVKLVVDKIKKK